MYKKAVASFWTVEEVDLSQDMRDWERLSGVLFLSAALKVIRADRETYTMHTMFLYSTESADHYDVHHQA